MKYEDFEEKMFSLFSEKKYCDTIFKINIHDENKAVITYTSMYSNPVDNLFQFGLHLVELFGTKAIDFDNDYNSSGCETCDYGSEYGTDYIINDITLNMDNLKQFCKKWGQNTNIYEESTFIELEPPSKSRFFC